MALYVFDGTGQKDEDTRSGGAKDTNPSRFLFAYRSAAQHGESYYAAGVGTSGFFRRLTGLFGGGGGRGRVKDGLEVLKANLKADPKSVVDVVGFSRGAALALHFVNAIAKGKARRRDGSIPTVRFLGLWDTVPSFGIPILPWNIGWNLGLPPNVQRCCHALSLDEQRGHFRLHRPEVLGDTSGDDSRLVEVWFRGVHSDIGGSGADEVPPRGLSSIALHWMFTQAQAVGLQFDGSLVKDNTDCIEPSATILDNLDPIETGYRDLRPSDVIHETVRFRPDHHNPRVGTMMVNDAGEQVGQFSHDA